jgi:hypothetical protein
MDIKLDLPKCVDCQYILPDNAWEHKCRKDLTSELKSAILIAIERTEDKEVHNVS